MPKLPEIVAVIGPTASGKTDLGIFLAKKFNGEVVSFDSRQVYIGMDIGTAKPAGEWRLDSRLRGNDNGRDSSTRPTASVGMTKKQVYIVEGVPHHLMDFVEPTSDYSLADFKADAIRAINDILSRGKLPILVGGTGLYFWAIIDNLDMPKVVPDKKLRAKLEKMSLAEMVKMLKEKDPDSAEAIDLKNPRRVLRALEVAMSGESFVKQKKIGKPLYDVLQIGLNWEREELNARIDKRVDRQIKEGLVGETEGLARIVGKQSKPRDPTPTLPLKGEGAREVWSLPSMSGIGYRQIGYHLRGEMSLPEAIEILKRDTRRYAKRQMTWFKRDKRIKWIERDDKKVATKLVEKFLPARRLGNMS